MLKGIISCARLPNSTNGNARYAVAFKPDGSDTIIQGKTRPDSQFTTNMPREGRASVSYHETPSGRIVFTNITREV